MKKKVLLFWATGLLLLGISGIACATTIIDFEGVIPVGSFRAGDPIFPYLEDGFLLTDVNSGSDNALFDPTRPLNNNGTDVLGWVKDTTFQISDASGDLFSILSFDGTNLGFLGSTPGSFEITGFLGSGGSISTSFINTLDSFSTFTFGSAWSGLSSVQITNMDMADGAIDNITLSSAPVPEPATMLLFGTGIAGLAVTRIRRKKK